MTASLTAQEQHEVGFLARRLLKLQGPNAFVYDMMALSDSGIASRGQLEALRRAIANPLSHRPKGFNSRTETFRNRLRRVQAASLTRRKKAGLI